MSASLLRPFLSLASTWRRCAVLAVATATLTTLALPALAVPKQLPLQGFLRANGGGPVVDGKYIVTVRLYGAPDAKDSFFKEVHFNVAVQQGLMGLVVGGLEPDKNPLPVDKLVGVPVWLGLAVDSEPEFPRQVLTSVPYALIAGLAESAQSLQCSGCVQTPMLGEGAVTADKLAASSVTSAKVAFAYAASSQKGGPADSALALACSGCVQTNHLENGAITPDKLAKGAVGSSKLDDEAVGSNHLQAGAVKIGHIDKATLALLQAWKGLTGVPAGFADGIDDTMTVDGLKGALKDNSFDLHVNTTQGGTAIARIHSAAADTLAFKATLDVDTGTTSPIVNAQAWFAEKDGTWQLAVSGSDPGTGSASGCLGCGNGKDGDYVASSNITLTGGTYQFKSFTILSGVTVTVTGSTPLDIQVLGTAAISGTLDLSGKPAAAVSTCCPDTPGGAGGGGGGADGGSGVSGAGNPGGGPGGGGGGCNAGYGAGGGGGGYSAGGAGGGTSPASCTVPGAGGTSYGDALFAGGLKAGSGGGAGGYGSAANATGSGGGGGGGAVKITAQTLTVASSGAIRSDGGKGGDQISDRDGGAGGGGSGGAIWLRASDVKLLGPVTTAGGAAGKSDKQASYGGDGGDGAAGRIRVDGATISGQSTPSYAKGDTTGLAPVVVNKFPISQPKPGVVRLTNLSGGDQKVRLVVIR